MSMRHNLFLIIINKKINKKNKKISKEDEEEAKLEEEASEAKINT